MNFLDTIFRRLQSAGDAPVLQEVRDGQLHTRSGRAVLAMATAARGFIVGAGLKKGDRCALLAPNGIERTLTGKARRVVDQRPKP